MLAVSMKGIVKKFPGIIANDHIDFDVEKNTVHCLLGENGSGKSTLMNVLFGLYHNEEGEIYINEKKISIKSPIDAQKCGIGMIHQHFMLIPQLTVLENIILGDEPGKFAIDAKIAKESVEKLINQYHFNLDINAKVVDISVGMKQRVEILKLLYRGADILIFDEPTAVLTPQEVDELFEIFKKLIAQGCTIIFITHKLNEIFAASDKVTILRKGKCVGTYATSQMNASKLSEMMVGRQIQDNYDLKENEFNRTVLQIKNLKLNNKNKDGISLSVKQGRIIGIAGIDGNGQMELEDLIVGTRKIESGSISICDKDVKQLSIGKRKQLGLAYIPSDRMRSGALGSTSIKENFLLGHQDLQKYKKHGFINFKNLVDDSYELTKQYDIKLVSIDQDFSGLSGGNQQKVVLAREVSKNIEFILAAQPTRGLDIGAIEYVHNTLLDLRDKGKGILLISAELSELLSICDEIYVLFDHKISAHLLRKDFDERKIGLAMIGDGGNDNE